LWFALFTLVLAVGLTPASLPAQGVGTAIVEGRVFDPARGEYLANARVVLEGGLQESFTDATGRYRLVGLPAGVVRLRVFFTGRPEQHATVTVAPGQVATLDVNLTASADAPGSEQTVRMSQFVVATTREMDGAAIAINEQRFAVDNRTVIAANEFGPRGEGEVGEVLQFLPGVSINSVNGNAYDISLDGVPADYVPVRVNGFDLASARETTSRMVVLQAAPTTHSLARIEVLNSPTPESPGSALAGSVNLVPLSAFERSRPTFNARVYLGLRDDVPDFNRTPGPDRNSTRKVHPGFNFTYVAPVNSRFGFTLSGGAARQYVRVESIGNTWSGAGSATNGTTLPDTTPDRPYLSGFNGSLRHKDAIRYSLGTTLDYKLTPNDRLSLSLQYVRNTQQIVQRTLTFATGGVVAGAFSPTSTVGTPGRGTVTLASGGRTVVDPGFTPTLTYRHDGPVWKVDGGLGHSRSSTSVQSLSRGHYFNTTSRLSGVTVGFDQVGKVRPATIRVASGATGLPVDPYSLDNYILVNGTGQTMDLQGLNRVDATQQSGYINAGRAFHGPVPFSLKAGVDIRQNVRDLKSGGQTTFAFVGADGVAGTSDDGAGRMLDKENSGTTFAYGLPGPQWVSQYTLYDHYRSNPSDFRIDRAAEYRGITNGSKRSEEIISAAFLRGDLALFAGRLKLVGGVRAEQTNIKAEGPLSDVTRNFQRDAAGNVLRSATGVPLRITADPLEAERLTLVDRGTRAAKEYLRWFPSLNASYQVRENLIFRAAYSQAVGRPNFNQYAGGITLPDTEAINQSSQFIRVNNAGIKAWSARTIKLRLEQYFEKVGLISVGVFRRNIEDFFGNVTFPATPEFLALYGLPADLYGPYAVITQHNVAGQVRMEGFEANYKQALTFLPHWARGVQVFANHTSLRATGDETANFDGFVPRIFNWGASLSRERFSAKVNWNHRSRIRGLPVTGRSIAANTFRWSPARLGYNVSAEYRFAKRYSLFANIYSGIETDEEILGPATPSHARLLSRQYYGGMWTFGLSGSF